MKPVLQKSRRERSAFSLIEIMVVITLLSVIIIGLMAMFIQTQRAFRLGMMQTDVLESGRLAMDMLVRELEQVTPSYQATTTNFLVELSPRHPLRPDDASGPFQPRPFEQFLPPTSQTRTNPIKLFFFVTCENRDWKGIGYVLDTPKDGVGTLYRFQNPTIFRSNTPAMLAGDFNKVVYDLYVNETVSPSLTRIVDGVVLLNLRPISPSGHIITNAAQQLKDPNNVYIKQELNYLPEDAFCLFYSNAVPAALDLELGILEKAAIDKYRSLPTDGLRREFLSNQVAHVHLFRQRVSVRNVDPLSYK